MKNSLSASRAHGAAGFATTANSCSVMFRVELFEKMPKPVTDTRRLTPT